jgi:hypothetical protein
MTGPDEDYTFDRAIAWVGCMNYDSGGWRMPTMDELEGLYKEGVGTRNMSPLLNTTGWWVWSGENRISSNSWGIFLFRHGYRHWYDRHDSYNKRAFAVRPLKQ